MKNILKLLTAISFLTIATTVAEANVFQKQRVEIFLEKTNIGNGFFGDKVNFPIKKAINDSLAEEGLRANDYQLMSVTLYAKSRKGQGKATLVVGGDKETRPVRKSPNGTWSGFSMNSMRAIRWDLTDNPGEASEGAWQLRLNGRIKVAHVRVLLRSKMRIVPMPLGNKMIGTSNQSETDRIKIKKMLNDRNIRPKNYRLRAVQVLAKSKGGKGKARLVVGNSNMGNKKVKKAPQGNFQKNQLKTYNGIHWMGLNESAQGNIWQVRFKGNNKAKRLIVVLKPIND